MPFEIIREEVHKATGVQLQMSLTPRPGGIVWTVQAGGVEVAAGVASDAKAALMTIDAVRRLWGAA
jgi:hypothetical protein